MKQQLFLGKTLLYLVLLLIPTLVFTQTQIGVDIDGGLNESLGISIDLSSNGTIVAIGATEYFAPGYVKILSWDGTNWIPMGNDINGVSTDQSFGYEISLSSDGNTLAVSAGRIFGVGHLERVVVFRWNGSTWNQLGNDFLDSDDFGYATSLSADGNTLAIGVPEKNSFGTDAGEVRVYSWNGSTWNQLGNIITGEGSYESLGRSVSLSTDGTRMAVGATGTLLNPSNRVRVFEWDGTSWIKMGNDIDGEAASDEFGGSVSISSNGTIVAIGAQGNDGSDSDAGHVRIYQWNGSNWVQVGSDIDGENTGDLSGNVSLSSDGTIVAIGAQGNDGSGSDAGHVRIYQWDGVNWLQIGNDIEGEFAGDNSGHSVSLSGDGTTLAIGAPNNDENGSNSGHVRLYETGITASNPTIPNPTIELSSSVLNATNTIDITGAHFTTGGLVELTITGNGSVQFANPTVLADGTFSHTISYNPSDPPGLYYVQAYDEGRELGTSTLNFLVEGQEAADLVITKNFDNYVIEENENFTISWKDKLLFDDLYTSNTTGLRSYNYHLIYSQDGGVTWLDPTPANGSAIEITGAGYVGEVITLDAQISIPQISPNTMIRVVDWYDSNRTDDSEVFSVISASGSPHVDIQLKLDDSFPVDILTGLSLLEDANGVAADGVARLLLKVVNNTTTNPITSMSINLVDEDDGFGTTSAMLGKLMQATVFDEYSDEANAATDIQITASVLPNQHEYYFWYVAPDDFNQNHGLYNTRSSRLVTAKFQLNYSNGYTEEITQNIEIVRPPLMLIHGLASSSATWNNFKYFSDSEKKFTEGNEFSVSKATDIHPHHSFYENAQLLLNVEFEDAPTNSNGLIEIEENSYQGLIYELRKKGYAVNQVDCVTHSMGGSVVRQSMFLPEFYNNNIINAYNNYGEGYINKFITLHTPHAGSPIADFLNDWIGELGNLVPCNESDVLCNLNAQVIEYAGEEIIASHILNNPNSILSQYIGTEVTGNISGHELVPTDAVLDLRVLDGEKFTEVTVPSHVIAGDILSGSLPNYSNIFNEAMSFGQDYTEFIQKFMDYFYAFVDVPTASQILSLSSEEQTFWNGLNSARTINEKTNRLLTWFEVFLTAYNIADFVLDSDMVVSVESQLSNISSTADNVTVNNGIGHSGTWGPLQNLNVGNDVFDLLNTGVANTLFGNLPSTDTNSSSINSGSSNLVKSTTNPLNPDSLFQQIQPGVVTNGIEIISPIDASSINVGEIINIEVSPNDTVGMDHISIYFQNEGYYFLPPFDTISLVVQTTGNSLDTQAIVAVALYDYNESLSIDSTAYATDILSVHVTSNEILQDFQVAPLVNNMTVGEHIAPEYLAIYSTFVAQLGMFDTDLDAVVNDISIIEFNEATKEFLAVGEGTTFADISYDNITERIFFNVTEPCVYQDRNVLIDIYNTSLNPNLVFQWDTTQCNICEWEGVLCNEFNRVISLDLQNKLLSPLLPNSFTQLTELEYLDLSANNILYLPNDFNQLTKLAHLDISNNAILYINPNISDLINLKHLDAENNRLYSNPNVIFANTGLEYLNIGGNELTELPPGIENMIQLKELDIHDNQLSSLPFEFSQINQLEILKASYNDFTIVPTEIFSLSNLIVLILNHNQLSDFPLEILGLQNLINLNLESNQITGVIPEDISMLTNLRSLNLGVNQFAGEIPAGIGMLTNMEQLRLYFNQLAGEIPAEMGQLSNLISLWLNDNNLSGCFPTELQNICSIPYYTFAGNPNLPGGGDFAAFCTNNIGNCCQPTYSTSNGNFLSGSQSGNPHFETDGIIQSDQQIEVGTNAIYDAGMSIELFPNFEVKLGAEFQAKIEGCFQSSSANILDANNNN